MNPIYQPDTLIARDYMYSESWLVDLAPRITVLPSAIVAEESNYQIDSLKRRDEYRWLLDKKHPVKLMNEKRIGDAPGLNFSPLGYYSKTETRKRRPGCPADPPEWRFLTTIPEALPSFVCVLPKGQRRGYIALYQ
jgi:hypothetical protein